MTWNFTSVRAQSVGQSVPSPCLVRESVPSPRVSRHGIHGLGTDRVRGHGIPRRLLKSNTPHFPHPLDPADFPLDPAYTDISDHKSTPKDDPVDRIA